MHILLFDEARYSDESFDKLNDLFNDDIEFVLNKNLSKAKTHGNNLLKLCTKQIKI